MQFHADEKTRINLGFTVASLWLPPLRRLAAPHQRPSVARLTCLSPAAHGSKTGTNTYAALSMVYESMLFLKENRHNKFNETQHVIIIVTDGEPKIIQEVEGRGKCCHSNSKCPVAADDANVAKLLKR